MISQTHIKRPLFELTFPIAYSIVAHKDPSQVERLIRSIYRTHNHYCIHIDLKSPQMFKILEKYASCFVGAQKQKATKFNEIILSPKIRKYHFDQRPR